MKKQIAIIALIDELESKIAPPSPENEHDVKIQEGIETDDPVMTAIARGEVQFV
jgi:hypothetical protein